jgi:hypothetical protein
MINKYIIRYGWAFKVQEPALLDPKTFGFIRYAGKCVVHFTKARMKESAIEHLNQGSHRRNKQLNRIKAIKFRETGQVDNSFDTTLFAQFWNEILNENRQNNNEPFSERLEYKIEFKGEGGIDAGGLRREFLTQMAEELESPSLSLLIPTANNKNLQGNNREKWTINPSPPSVKQADAYRFLGRLIGSCIISDQVLPLDLPSLVWKKLLGQPVDAADLMMVDTVCVNCLDSIKALDNVSFDEAIDLTFTTVLSNGKEVELIPGGKGVKVTYDRRFEYANLVINARLSETDAQIALIREGLNAIIPPGVMLLYIWEELEKEACGLPNLDVEELKKCTEYEVPS